MAEKLYYSMGEVSEMFDVRPSLIRYWGEQFNVLKPHRNKKGNRMFTPKDIETLKLIYHLVKERGMTLDGAKRAMRKYQNTTDSPSPKIALMEQLQHLRSLLVDIKNSLGEEPSRIVDEAIESVENTVETVAESIPEGEAKPKRRRGRPRKNEISIVPQNRTITAQVETVREVPLIPFYEQTLF